MTTGIGAKQACMSAAGWSANDIHNSVLLTKTEVYDVIQADINFMLHIAHIG